ncbi:sel1 repeat family protein [Verrucomicrobia bacterium]|nr:sel1 repeat family protein [bacterium]MDB4777120.1 sel1 repeat family protein [Verrucomicrobiota bacterium]MDC0266693.1 sel1 repeat family protein [bacterium]
MELSEEQMEAIRLKAEEGDRDAQYELGWRHAIGMGFDMDDEVALDWISKAAEQGHPLAQNNLGARYYSGDGVELDILQAYIWFYRAASQNDRKAAKNRDAVFRQLSEEQKDKARAVLPKP